MPDGPTFFRTAAAFRRWLAQHHAQRTELTVGFYRKDTGRGGITYAEALDEALCYGWIDGLKRRHDEVSYTHRFTPRRARSNWSAVNLRHYARLVAEGRVAPPGEAARAAWDATKSPESVIHGVAGLSPEYRRVFTAQNGAWSYFQQQAPWYRRMATFWVMSAKAETTRRRRLGELISHSAHGRRLPQVLGQPVKRRPR